MKKIRFSIFAVIIGIVFSLCIYSCGYANEQQNSVEITQSVDTTESSPQKSYNANNTIGNDLLIEFIGAFLAVLSALGLNSHSNKKQYKELNKSLHNELLTLESDLNKRLTKNLDYYRYLTPVWDINLASGNLSLLSNGKINQEYIEIYSKIQYAQELEREYIHGKLMENQENENNRFLKDYISTIDSARIREANEIKSLIDNLKKKEVK